MTSFDFTQRRGEVTFGEFEEFYEGLSVGVANDDDFVNIIRNAWNV